MIFDKGSRQPHPWCRSTYPKG